MLGRAEIAMVYLWFAHPSGLIEDQRGAYTMQYHAFCVALLGELLADPLISSTWVRTWFQRSIVILFGRARFTWWAVQLYRARKLAVVRICGSHSGICTCLSDFRNSDYLEKASEVLSYLERFQRTDGSFPLVFI